MHIEAQLRRETPFEASQIGLRGGFILLPREQQSDIDRNTRGNCLLDCGQPLRCSKNS